MERYVRAWNSNDRAEIGELFSDDASYLSEPYAEPWRGRDEIVSEWLARKDDPGDTTFRYEVSAATQEIGIVKGVTEYRSTGTEYFNLWEITLDASGRCSRFVEWWMEKPRSS